MAIDPVTGQEEEEQIYPSALPGANKEQMGAIRDDLFGQATRGINESGVPGFDTLKFDDTSVGDWDDRPLASAPMESESTGWDDRPLSAPAEEEEDKPGYLSNIARLTGQRALDLTGSLIRGAGEIGADLDENTGRFVWDDGIIPSWYSAEEFKELEKKGVTENLLTETIPMAFQDRDLGGEKTSSPDRIKEGWRNGDIGETAAAAGTFIAETFIESIPDMVATVYNLPLYALARSQEIGEERVRNERLSEALAANPELSPAEQNKLATGYVRTEDIDTGDIAKAAPFATLSALLERFGAKGITTAGTDITSEIATEAVEHGMRYALREGGKAGLKEAGTEFFQEGVIEYFGEKLGTGADMSVAEGAERGAWAALAGYGGGQVAGTGAAALRSLGAPIPETDVDDEGNVVTRPTPDDTGGGGSGTEKTQDGMSQAEREALGNAMDDLEQGTPEQGGMDLPPAPPPTTPPPAPTQDQATTQTPPVNETAPVASVPEGGPTPVEDEVVTQEDLVTEPTPEPEAAPAEPVESPMIQEKEVVKGFRELNTRIKGGKGVTKAFRELGVAIAAVFPEAKGLPAMKGSIGAPRIGKYFAALDEEVRIDETLPNLKGFLAEVMASPDEATAVQNINRLKDYVAASGAGIATEGTKGTAVEQGAAGITKYDVAEAERLSKKTEYTTTNKKTGEKVKRTRISGKANRLANRAVVLDELASTVEALVKEASERGMDVPSETMANIRRARSWRESSSTAKPYTLKGGAGAVVTKQKFQGKNIDKVGKQLREVAESLTKQLSAVDVPAKKVSSTAPKKTKGKAKVKKTSPATKAPAKPKKVKKEKKPTLEAKVKKAAKERAAKKVDPAVQANMDELLDFAGHVLSKAPADFRRTALKNFVNAFRRVGHGVENLSAPARKTIEKALGVEPGTSIEDMMAAAYVIQKDFRAQNQAAGEVQVQQLERQREIDEQQAADEAYDKLPLKEAEVKKVAKEKAEVKINDLLAKKPEDLTYNELRKVAKHLGVKATGKKETILADVKAWGETAAEAVATPKVTTKKQKKIADPKKVLEEPKGKKAPPLAVGRQASKIVEELGMPEGTTLAEALEEKGISKKAATTLKGIISALPEKGQTQVLRAIKDYRGPQDNLEIITKIKVIAGEKVSNKELQDVLEFLGGQAQNQQELAAEEAALQDDAELLAREKGYESAEEMYAYENETGYGDSVEYGDLHFEEMKELVDRMAKQLSGKDKAELEALGGDGFLGSIIDSIVEETNELDSLDRDTAPHLSTKNFLRALIDGLPKNSKYRALAERLAELELDVPIYFFDDPSQLSPNADLTGRFTWNLSTDNRVIGVVQRPNIADTVLTALHEIVHAATTLRYHADVKFKAYTNEMYRQALNTLPSNFADPTWAATARTAVNAATAVGVSTKQASDIINTFLSDAIENADPRFMKMNPKSFYGLINPTEFLAEVFVNPQFQAHLSKHRVTLTQAMMKNRVPGGPRRAASVLHAIMDAITRFVLRMSPRNTILKEVMFTGAQNFLSEQQVQGFYKRNILNAKQRARRSIDRMKGKKRDTEEVEAMRDLEAAADGVNDGVKAGVKKVLSGNAKGARAGGKKAILGISGRDAIERDNRSLFDKAADALGITNPLTRLNNAKNRAQTLVRKYEKQAFNILTSFSKMPNRVRSITQMMMKDITMANIDPTKPLNSAANRHIWTNPTQTPKPRQKKDGTWVTPKAKKPQIRKKFKDRAIKARDNWLQFEKKYPVAAKVMKNMAALTKQIHDTKVAYALTALGEAFEFDTATTNALGRAKTKEDIDKIIDPNEVEILTAQLEAKDDLVGMTKEEKKDLKKKITQAEARAQAATSAKTILRESSIKGWYFPLRRYGQYVVSTGPDVTGEDVYVAFFETEQEAQLERDRINANASEENQVRVSQKLTASNSRGSVSSVMTDLKRRINDGPTLARLDGAMAEILAANASYESQLKRDNVEGVASKDMARAFEEYVHVSKYTLGDIRMAHQISEASRDINMLAKNTEEAGLTDEEVFQLGRVQAEIAKRNMAEGGDRKKNKVQKYIGLIGFLNFLGAPSYWALNATQTYVVTIPYLAAKYGEAKGPAALMKAQKVVLAAAARAAKGKDKSYEGFKAQLPPAARKIVEELEADNIIQSTIAHEFGDIMDPNGFKRMRNNSLTAPVAKGLDFALKVMEKVPEGIEHYNRISTALATYELSDGDYVATKDAVNETQMNYDTNNRARLLKSLPGDTAGTTTPYVTPIMMFKTFGVGMLKLFYGAALDVVYKEGGRKEALKMVGYLMTTHTIFGGAAGGLMIAPIAAIIAVVNSMLEPDDEWSLDEATDYMREELDWDLRATAIEKGIPAAVLGIDMSRSINLGNLIWMGDDRLDYTEYGDLQQGAFQVFGPVAQYAANATREGARLLTGDPRGGMMEFMQAAFPVKAVRGTLQAIEYQSRGLETSSELQLMAPEDFTAFLRTVAGFQTTQKTNVRDRYYSDQRLDMRRTSRKSDLIVKANRAIMDGEWSKLDSLLDSMMAYNLSVPEAKHRVTAGDMARLRSRRRTAQREYDREYRYSN